MVLQEYPIKPPKMIFDTEMWHPNSASTTYLWPTADKQSTTLRTRRAKSVSRFWSVSVIAVEQRPRLSLQHPPEEDQYGYEDAGERWLPVHTVETVVRAYATT